MTAPQASPAEPIAAKATPPQPAAWRRLAAEPLLHFVALGLCLFAADLALSRWRDDTKTITIPAAATDEARTIFKSSMGREPSAAEMKVLLDRWVDNEVLYREGVAQGLERGDTSIRERVIFKSLSVTQSGLSVPPATEPVLRAWFAQHHERYDQPARFDFLEAVPGGDNAAASVQMLADTLNGKAKGEVDSSLRVFRERPRGNLVQSYGEPFTKALEGAAPGTWLVLRSGLGQHVMRLESIKPAVPARYEDLRDVVRKDWQEQTMSQMTTDAVREMGKKYKVEQEKPAAAANAVATDKPATEKAPS